MDELERFLDAVLAMREAQRLELAALPSNLSRWKRVRQQMSVSRLEEQVDMLAAQLRRSREAAGATEPAEPKPPKP